MQLTDSDFPIFLLWAGKCKWATLIYLGILLETYSETCQRSKMELFAKTAWGFQPLEEVKRIGSSKSAVNK